MIHTSDNRTAKSRTSSPGNSKPHASAVRHSNGASSWRGKYEQYRNLAQQPGDADRVTRETYWQHAEHFIRLMNGSAAHQA
jgi:hypothetical protein